MRKGAVFVYYICSILLEAVFPSGSANLFFVLLQLTGCGCSGVCGDPRCLPEVRG
jgi:hypothetical protein